MSSNAARPTYFAAVGYQQYGGIRSRQQCAKDQVGFTKMKLRVTGQNTVQEVKAKSLKEELDEREEVQVNEKNKLLRIVAEPSSLKKEDVPLMLKNLAEIDTAVINKYDDADEVDYEEDEAVKKSGDNNNGGDGFDESSDDDDDDDDEDEEAVLQRELDRIREERAMAQAKKAEEEAQIEAQHMRDEAVKGNPLMVNSEMESAKIKRRWNDDVVFRNQARDEPEHKKRFVNDAIRSDFHRSFLKKYVQ